MYGQPVWEDEDQCDVFIFPATDLDSNSSVLNKLQAFGGRVSLKEGENYNYQIWKKLIEVSKFQDRERKEQLKSTYGNLELVRPCDCETEITRKNQP